MKHTERVASCRGRGPTPDLTARFGRTRQSYSADPDAALVKALRSGDMCAFDDLLHRYDRRLFRVAWKITRNRQDAEEVVQDSLLKVFTHLEGFRGESLFSSWLIRIAINKALMKIRGTKRNIVALDEEIKAGDYAFTREIKDSRCTPEQVCSQRELLGVVLRLAKGVRPSCRRVFELHMQEDLSNLDIGRILGITEATAKARLFRARQDLKRSISKHFSSAQFPFRAASLKRNGCAKTINVGSVLLMAE